MIFGVDYYPEHWKCEEWEAQAKLMKEGGFQTVRMADFAWGILEKKEGEFDFSLFDEAMEVLAKEGIQVIFCTPTAAPPKWLVNRYDVLQRDRYGRKEEWGSRRECCANNPDFQAKSRIMVEKMAEHYGNNPQVIGWQIDNEFGCHGSTRCYCEHCRREFGKWLSGRYENIEELNKRWGTAFWSLDFDSFEDVILPGYTSCEGENYPNFAHNPSLDLEYRRFASDSWVRYQQMQIDILRKYTEKPITHNMMGHFSDIDYYKLGENLDFVSWDNYPDNQWGDSQYEYVAMAHETMRGIKNKNFVVMEEQAGPAGWDRMGQTPRPGQLRLWTYQALAHGAEGMVYFRFRTALFGMEQYWYGVLDHDGVPGRRFAELQRTGQELQKLESYIVGAKNKYEALLVKSYDNVWAHEIKRHTDKYHYGNLLYDYFKANADENVSMAVSCLWEGLRENGYKAVYMPSYNVVTEEEAEAVRRYVEQGGVLVLTFRSGTRDKDNNMRPMAVPGVFGELAGIRVEEFDALRREVAVSGEVTGKAKIWCDIIEPVTAKVLAVYDSEYYKGRAAVTVNEYGKGKVFYAGCDLDGDAMRQLVVLVSDMAGIGRIEAPKGVEIIRRESCKILLNHNEEEVSVPVQGYSLLQDKEFDGKLEPYGVEFLKSE